MQQCIGLLTSLIHCKRGVFATAGTKDKRAVTVQSITAFKVLPGSLTDLGSACVHYSHLTLQPCVHYSHVYIAAMCTSQPSTQQLSRACKVHQYASDMCKWQVEVKDYNLSTLQQIHTILLQWPKFHVLCNSHTLACWMVCKFITSFSTCSPYIQCKATSQMSGVHAAQWQRYPWRNCSALETF